jgi:hypothetical protein
MAVRETGNAKPRNHRESAPNDGDIQGGREVRIKYKRSIYGMSPTCKARPTVKVGSLSCEECEYCRGKAFGFIGKETTVGGRKIDLYGGWVECAAPEMQGEQEEE